MDLYAEPYAPQKPVVCFDETSTQLLAETRPALPAQPGRPLRQDYEYRREGTRNLFLACEPLAFFRLASRGADPAAHRPGLRPADALAGPDEAYPEAEVVRVVLDNLNTHRPASLYQTFPAAEARRIAKRLELITLHPQARQLAVVKAPDGGDRVQRFGPLLPQTAASRRGAVPSGRLLRSPGSGAGAQRRKTATIHW